MISHQHQSYRRRRTAGDTIVEVLICILLMSIILGGAYTTVRRSSLGIRNSQEHAEALKRLESQVEQLRTNASSAAPTVFTFGTPFCMVDGATVSLISGPDTAKCTQNASGLPSTVAPSYKLSIQRSIVSGRTLFTVRADWDAITGTPAQETIFLRMKQ